MTTAPEPGPRGRPGQTPCAPRRLGRRTFAQAVLTGLLAGCRPWPVGPSRQGPSGRLPPFDAARAFADLERQVAFGPRVPGTPGHDRCRAFLVATLGAAVDRLTLQRFTVQTSAGPLALVNIVGQIAPDRRPRVLLCAHWDTRPRAERDPDPARRSQPVPGANDGASGVAVLLEVARQVSGLALMVGLDVVFFDGEDWGETPAEMFLGSRFYAAHLGDPLPAWGLLLDMVGDRDLVLYPEAHSQDRAPALVDRIWTLARDLGYAAVFRPEPGPAILDDHLPFLERGIPVIDLIDIDYPYWHTTADTPEKCAPASLAVVGQVVLAALPQRGS